MKIVKILTSLLFSIIMGSIASVALGTDPGTTIAISTGISTGAGILSYVTGWSMPGMAMAVDISSLSASAVEYQKDLQMLPIAILSEELGKLGIALLPNVQDKDVLTYFERSGGIMKPYISGNVVNDSLGKAVEKTLQVYTAYAAIKDNIQNYKSTKIGADSLLGKNTNKKHPWERTMLWAVMSTFGEDLQDCLFGGTRNASGTTPKDLFDGYDTLITNAISANEISAGKGNYYSTGAITAPASATDTDAFDQLWALWASSHPALKKIKTIMGVPWDVYVAYQQAHFNKYKYAPKYDEFERIILEGTGGNCKLVPSTTLGTGDRVYLSAINNFHFGMNSDKDHSFVQVRQPYTDPNEIQFWIQGAYGIRVSSFNKKVFCVNDGTPIHSSVFAGDYDSAAS